jgi:hypothetical protein
MRSKLMLAGATIGLICGGMWGAASGYAPARSGVRSGGFGEPRTIPWSTGASVDSNSLGLGFLLGAAAGMAGGWAIAEAAKRDSVKA